MWGQVFTLAGVVLGAAGSFIATTLLERGRYRRDKAVRWDAASLQAFSDYLKANTTDLRHADFDELVTWDFVLV